MVRELTSRYRTELERVWLCPYCNNEFVAIRSQLTARAKRGTSTAHCGCQTSDRRSATNLGRVPPNKMDDTAASVRMVIRQCANRTYSLTLNEVATLVTTNCHYCGCPPNHYRPLGSGEWSRVSKVPTHGIDRMDSSEGYHSSNVVTCCTYCNYLKGDRPYSEFVAHIKQIAQHLAMAAGLGAFK